MRYELTDNEWTTIRPMLPNKPRGDYRDCLNNRSLPELRSTFRKIGTVPLQHSEDDRQATRDLRA